MKSTASLTDTYRPFRAKTPHSGRGHRVCAARQHAANHASPSHWQTPAHHSDWPQSMALVVGVNVRGMCSRRSELRRHLRKDLVNKPSVTPARVMERHAHWQRDGGVRPEASQQFLQAIRSARDGGVRLRSIHHSQRHDLLQGIGGMRHVGMRHWWHEACWRAATRPALAAPRRGRSGIEKAEPPPARGTRAGAVPSLIFHTDAGSCKGDSSARALIPKKKEIPRQLWR